MLTSATADGAIMDGWENDHVDSGAVVNGLVEKKVSNLIVQRHRRAWYLRRVALADGVVEEPEQSIEKKDQVQKIALTDKGDHGCM